MQNFSFHAPTKFVFGTDALEKVGQELTELGVKKVLIHFGGGSALKNGSLDRVKASLQKSSIDFVELGGVRPNPEVSLVREGIKLARKEKVDLVLAVGGGSVIDSSKAIAGGFYYEGDVWDFYQTKKRPQKFLPVATVLTIPAAGSEGSASNVISNDELGIKNSYSSDYLRPKVSFLDPRLTFSLPPYQTAAGITDMYAHVLERFFSASENTPVTDNIAIALFKTLKSTAHRVLENPEDYKARATIEWTGMLCHNGIAGCGREEDWTSHALEHELSAFDTKITHGAGLAVIFPAWMRYVYKENPERFAYYGEQVFGNSRTEDLEADARLAIEQTQAFFISLGMPKNLEDLGVHEEDIESLLPNLMISRGESFGSFKKLSKDDAREIYKLAL